MNWKPKVLTMKQKNEQKFYDIIQNISQIAKIKKRLEENSSARDQYIDHLNFNEKFFFTKDGRCLKNYDKHLSIQKKSLIKSCQRIKRKIKDSIIFKNHSRKKLEVARALEIA